MFLKERKMDFPSSWPSSGSLAHCGPLVEKLWTGVVHALTTDPNKANIIGLLPC